ALRPGRLAPRRRLHRASRPEPARSSSPATTSPGPRPHPRLPTTPRPGTYLAAPQRHLCLPAGPRPPPLLRGRWSALGGERSHVRPVRPEAPCRSGGPGPVLYVGTPPTAAGPGEDPINEPDAEQQWATSARSSRLTTCAASSPTPS